MPTKFCPHCGKRTGFQVKFNIVVELVMKKKKAICASARNVEGDLSQYKKMNA